MTRHRRTERASSLMLVPAGVLVLMVLASISADSAVAYLAKRELQNQAAAAVNDAVTAGISGEALQEGEDARPDPERAAGIVHAVLDGYSVAGMVVDADDVSVTSTDTRVSVVVEGEVPYVFAKAVPGADRTATVRATGTAELKVR